MYRVPERICRTVDGRLVREGDPDAAFLAYPAGTELSDEEADRFGLLAFAAPGAAKVGPRSQDKMVRRTRNKGGQAVAPGVVADTSIDGEAHVLVPEPGSPLRNGVDK